MSEKETNAKGPKCRFSKLAIASALVVVLWALILYFRGVIVYPKSLRVLVWNIMSLVALIGFILGVVAIERIMRSKWALRGGVLAIVSIVLTALLWNAWLLQRIFPPSTAYRMVCGSNLSRLGRAMLIYANDHEGQYPDPNRWCELLLQYGKVDLKHFICPTGTFPVVLQWPPYSGEIYRWPELKKGASDYAMNPNCKPSSPPDTVLLFESKGGWNQFGGQELLGTEHHYGFGCNILYNDGHVQFKKIKGLAELNWGDEQKDK